MNFCCYYYYWQSAFSVFWCCWLYEVDNCWLDVVYVPVFQVVMELESPVVLVRYQMKRGLWGAYDVFYSCCVPEFSCKSGSGQNLVILKSSQNLAVLKIKRKSCWSRIMVRFQVLFEPTKCCRMLEIDSNERFYRLPVSNSTFNSTNSTLFR